MCTADGSLQVFPQALLVWLWEPLQRQEGLPHRTLLVPTKDPGFLGARGHDIQESILGPPHLLATSVHSVPIGVEKMVGTG